MLSLITATRNRAELLASTAIPSILAQSDRTFEWIVINDGGDSATRNLVQQLHLPVALKYLEIDHASNGFGLCYARNTGLELAQGELVAYLDDDNSIAPNFIEAVRSFFRMHPKTACSMVQQCRRRNVVREGKVVKQGKPFVSPASGITTVQLVTQEALFDSNGFTHKRDSAPRWNPEFRVFADYEYFLQCLGLWGINSFALHDQVLVEYIQTSQGVIGQSNYEQWAVELELLYSNTQQYPILGQTGCDRWLPQLIERFRAKHNQGQQRAEAFQIS